MLKEQELREKLKSEIIGQDRAVDAMVRAVMVADLGICDPQRPLGTFLFLGPTGTGKSQIGRSLAQILHGNDSGLVVINCTEFKNPHDVSKLTGAPPGYIGHDHPPFLTPEKLEKKATIVIFEELEKADRALNDLLLQVLERGEMKTGLGTDLSFRNCFIILTSNVCAKEVDQITTNSGIGFNPVVQKLEELDKDIADDKIHSVCLGAVEDFFNPEFINRIDEIVTFNRLKDEHLLAILEKFLSDTRSRLAAAGIAAIVSEAAKRFLIRKGTNLRYGARPLRRAVREYLEYPLAALIAERGATQNQIVRVEAGEEALSFTFARMAAAS
ncbi:MAG: ATPase domain protein [Acidobacteria bacterium]|nr:ATPase domain protein [Acidobacteriota bacterium]